MHLSILPSFRTDAAKKKATHKCGRGWQGTRPPGCTRAKKGAKKKTAKGKRKASFSGTLPSAKPKKTKEAEAAWATAKAKSKLAAKAKAKESTKVAPKVEAKPKPKTPGKAKAATPAKQASMPGAQVLNKKPVEKKLPKIKTDKDFDKFLKGHAADINTNYFKDGIVPIKDLEDRFKAHGMKPDEFKKRIVNSFKKTDDFDLISTEKLGALGHRHYTKNKELQEESRNAYHVKIGERRRDTLLIRKQKSFPENTTISAWNSSKVGAKSGEAIPDQKSFNQAAQSIVSRKRKNESDLVLISDVREAMGDRITRKDFSARLLKMQSEDKAKLMGGGDAQFGPSIQQVENSVQVPGGSMRFYVKVSS